jgi:hypothetical protein
MRASQDELNKRSWTFNDRLTLSELIKKCEGILATAAGCRWFLRPLKLLITDCRRHRIRWARAHGQATNSGYRLILRQPPERSIEEPWITNRIFLIRRQSRKHIEQD